MHLSPYKMADDEEEEHPEYEQPTGRMNNGDEMLVQPSINNDRKR